MRLLIVDDAKTDLDACRTSAKKWNKSHSSESQIILIEKKTFPEAQEYFACHESCDVDGIILDLKLARQADAGQKLIEDLDALHRRVPIVVFTATQDPLTSYHYLLGKFTKGDKPYAAAFEKFDAARRIGLTKILGCDGIIDQQLKKIFDRVIMERFDSWVKFSERGEADVERSLSRSVVEHLHDVMDVESDKYAPDEFYITKLDAPSKYVATGEILRSCDGNDFVVVISPACDLALHPPACVPKSEVVQVCLLEGLDAWETRTADCVRRRIERTAKEEEWPEDKTKEAIQQEFAFLRHKVLTNQYAAYYHYFPAAVGFNGMLLNFRMIEKYTHKKLKKAYTQTGYKVSPYFFRDVQSRFSAYYGRQGQPEICSL